MLAEDMRDDDAEGLISAIQHLRGVLSVEMHVSDIGTHMAETRAKSELKPRLLEVLR